MAVFHDEVEIEDFEFDEDNQLYHFPCPCGDRFEITKYVCVTHRCFVPRRTGSFFRAYQDRVGY